VKWEEFKKLEIDKQIDKFNELIKEHGSIIKAASELGISDSTTRKYFKSHGVTFNGSEYVKNTNTQLEGQTSLVEPVSDNKGILNINELSEKNKSKTDITELEQIVNKLIDKRLEDLKKIEKTGEIELNSECEGEVKYRSFGVYRNVLDKFVKFTDDHPRYNKVELLSHALMLMMELYE
jgi:predicted transcriptional regulator